MNVLLVVVLSGLLLILAGRVYSGFIARRIGEDPSRATPAVRLNDGRDYVPTPTSIVFAHHFAAIAGAGPILGPVIAVVYGWGPALIWVVGGGILIGAAHDYLATHMAVREGGTSLATVARRYFGRDAFVALTLFLVLALSLVCAAFLNFSAKALVSMLPEARLGLGANQTLFRVVGGKAVIGGIASMSVIVITVFAPLIGWLYLRRKVAVWKCSLLSVLICAVGIVVGLFYPVTLSQNVWIVLLSIYVLLAAGLPVWLFIQSRDFINVHILYIGMGLLVAALVTAGLRGKGSPDPLPAVNVAQGSEALGWMWPFLFITIACGAVSGFHSLCAGGTTCKQLTNEPAVRRIGYYAMLLESFLAVCVIGVMMMGAGRANYIKDVHTYLLTPGTDGNAVLGFAMGVGNVIQMAFGLPIVVGALGGMILLEGFLVTTLDVAVRLMRYLIEEVWKSVFGHYDVFADAKGPPAAETEVRPAGAAGLTAAPTLKADASPVRPIPTSGLFRQLLLALRRYWINSGLAVALTLLFALSGGATALWHIFATSNQLLAAFGLSIAAVWLMRHGKRYWFALIPAVAMLLTTMASMLLLGWGYLRILMSPGSPPPAVVGLAAEVAKKSPWALFLADLVMMALTAYLIYAGLRTFMAAVRLRTVGAVTGD
ncbi:MAG: Peptide transporter CstA [Phycisphaerae bacterium]|nr:Peptide transporter CstA [Phycisphaerae bacterium]